MADRIHSVLLGTLFAIGASCAPAETAPAANMPATGRAASDPASGTVGAHPAAATPPSAPTAAPPAPAAPPGKMLAIAPTEYGRRLTALGLDMRHLPRIEDMDRKKVRVLMDYVSEATGAACTDCHVSETDFKAPTPMKRVAARMWDDWTRGYAMQDGSAVFCDSCHQGSLAILDRRDPMKIEGWMKDNFVAKLVRRDGGGAAHPACASCHGAPFDADFLEKWKTGGSAGHP